VTDARRLRIGFVYDGLYPYTRGGAERRYHELAVRLAERYEVHRFSWRYRPDQEAGQPGLVHHPVGPAEAFYGSDGRRTIREAASFAGRLVPSLLRHRVDVLDCSATPYVPLYGCALAARLTGTPLIVTWHEWWGDYWAAYLADRPLAGQLGQWCEAGCRGLGDIRVAVSDLTARALAGSGPSGADGRPVRVVGNGAPIEAVAAASPGAERFDVAFVGRLIRDKQVDLLLEALAIVARARPAVRCAIIGEGPEREQLEALAGSLGLANVVRFLGGLDEAGCFGVLKASRTLALLSAREGYGIAVVEAQAAGAVPIVARGPLTAAPELVRDGVDGIVCDPTPDAAAAAIERVLAEPDVAARLSLAAREAAVGRDWDRAALAMEDIYLEAIARRVGRRRDAERVELDAGLG
jgi:glycosyltransferase involved in cell wall biosynthesis